MAGKVQKTEVPNLTYLKRIVRKGSEGKDVIATEAWYFTYFYNFHPGESLDDTGSFGRKTHSFVVRFQIRSDLCTDGWVDKATADSIEDFLSKNKGRFLTITLIFQNLI
jgi:hypothetical protein